MAEGELVDEEIEHQRGDLPRRQAMSEFTMRGTRATRRILHGPRWRVSLILVPTVAGLLLAGCGSARYDLAAADAVGTARAGNDLSTRIELREDGTFEATGWPGNAWCEDRGTPGSVDRLDRDDRRSFSGTWEVRSQGTGALSLHRTGGDECQPAMPMNFREEDGEKYGCFFLPGTSLSSVTVENLFVFYWAEPRTQPLSDSCFSYN